MVARGARPGCLVKSSFRRKFMDMFNCFSVGSDIPHCDARAPLAANARVEKSTEVNCIFGCRDERSLVTRMMSWDINYFTLVWKWSRWSRCVDEWLNDENNYSGNDHSFILRNIKPHDQGLCKNLGTAVRQSLFHVNHKALPPHSTQRVYWPLAD